METLPGGFALLCIGGARALDSVRQTAAHVQITLTIHAHAVPKPRQGASDRMAMLLHQSGNKMETSEEKAGESRLAEAS